MMSICFVVLGVLGKYPPGIKSKTEYKKFPWRVLWESVGFAGEKY